ncbi:zinc finger MYND domain-containing protein 10 isoform X2 [Thrips palmi]|uniref:Zinc finger MYND domain-containing protein 10 isoform X2 n=1 Tax=Thrips palmi TaxID=161013 RepID=A0A6P8Z3M1_THRPL|nr:zinc finger MYND domain-containing protein 10 isoform X2 [Thrips palmi]
MDEDTFDVLNAAEIEHYVLSLRPSKIDELGTEFWLQTHEFMQKLSQQAVLEASEHREEVVKELMATHSKVSVLVHEAICISVWREKVLPELLRLEENIKDTFLVYCVLFHEATAVALLETVLFHGDSCEALGDTAVDLLDYCMPLIYQICAGYKSPKEPSEASPMDSIKDQEMIICFNIGMRCISILQYLIESMERLYTHHDVPLLLVHLLEVRPWERTDPKHPGRKLKFSDGQWIEVKGEDVLKLTRTEGQVWLALRQILLRESCARLYDFSDFRRSQLQKVLRYMTDPLLDQVSPLIDLKQFLCHLQISSGPSSTRKPLILEVIPEIRKNFLDWGSRKWRKIAKIQLGTFFQKDQGSIQKMAQSLSSAYNLDVLDRLGGDMAKCAGCGDPAPKRCSRCKTEWYCGRECQVKCWSNHKQVCNSVVEAAEYIGKKETETKQNITTQEII